MDTSGLQQEHGTMCDGIETKFERNMVTVWLDSPFMHDHLTNYLLTCSSTLLL